MFGYILVHFDTFWYTWIHIGYIQIQFGYILIYFKMRHLVVIFQYCDSVLYYPGAMIGSAAVLHSELVGSV